MPKHTSRVEVKAISLTRAKACHTHRSALYARHGARSSHTSAAPHIGISVVMLYFADTRESPHIWCTYLQPPSRIIQAPAA